MQLFGRFLNRAIFSHLLVAVPPAVILGQVVIEVTRPALLQEVQNLNLVTASLMRDRIQAELGGKAGLLGHAERVLDLDIEIHERQALLTALAADAGQALTLYTPEGIFDSQFRPKDMVAVDRQPIPRPAQRRAASQAWAVWPVGEELRLVMAWRQGEDMLGFLATSVPRHQLEGQCMALVERHIGLPGALDVVSVDDGRFVASSAVDHRGTPAPGTTADWMASQRGILSGRTDVTHEFTDSEGQIQLVSVVPMPQLGWVVGAYRPRNVALASLNVAQRRLVVLSLIAALAAGLVGLLLARQISRPVQDLVYAVRRAAQRGFSMDSKVHATGELGRLAESFNYALSQMAEYRRQLRETTQLRLRLARLSPGSGSAREMLARTTPPDPSAPTEPIAVLYADLVIDHSGSLETEHLVTILGEFFTAAHEAIHQEGGRLDRYSGDVVIGLFPEATTPSPSRAAFSAARMIVADAQAISDRWSELSPLRLHASVGVVFGSGHLVAEDPSGDPTVHGDLVERAATLQQHAYVSSVVVDEAAGATLDLDAPLVPAAGDTGALMWTADATSKRPPSSDSSSSTS